MAFALALGGPARAGAEVSDPFNGVPNPSSTTTTTTTSTEGTSSLSTSSSAVIFALVLGGLLLAGIAYMIVRDARGVAPVGEGGVNGRSAGDSAAAMRRRRAKAKAARRQRKRNR